MKLLLDENLSHRLLPVLEREFPGSAHVGAIGLSGAADGEVWRHARDNGFALVSKDDDFLAIAARHGPPPIVIRLSLGNSQNSVVLSALLGKAADLRAAAARPDVSVIELG